MSLITLLVTVDSAVAPELKKLGQVAEKFVLTEYQKFAAEVNATPLATTATNIISLLASHNIPGAQKMDQLEALALPAYEKLQAAGGLSGLATSIKDFTKRHLQDLYEDFVAAAAPVVEKALDQAPHAQLEA